MNLYKHRIYCETEAAWVYLWKEDATALTVCPTNPAHTVTEGSASIVEQPLLIHPQNKEGTPVVESCLRHGMTGEDSFTVISPDLTDRSTWYQNAAKISNEVLSEETTTNFKASKAYWIDLYGTQSGNKGISHDYKGLIQKNGTFVAATEYIPIVKINDVVTEPDDATNPYTIDYNAGEINFTGSQTGKTIKATFYHTDGISDRSQWIYSPAEGETITIQHVEMQFSEDMDFSGKIIHFDIFAGADVATYEALGWDRTHPCCQEWSDYRSVRDLINWCNNDYPKLVVSGSPEFTKDVLVFPFKYLISPELAQGGAAGYPVIRLVLKNDTPFTCEMATITFYAVKH